MLTYNDMKAKLLEDPAVRAEVERLEREEMPALDAILRAKLHCLQNNIKFDIILA